MKTGQFNISLPRYIAGKVLGAVHEPLFGSGLSCLRTWREIWKVVSPFD